MGVSVRAQAGIIRNSQNTVLVLKPAAPGHLSTSVQAFPLYVGLQRHSPSMRAGFIQASISTPEKWDPYRYTCIIGPLRTIISMEHLKRPGPGVM